LRTGNPRCDQYCEPHSAPNQTHSQKNETPQTSKQGEPKTEKFIWTMLSNNHSFNESFIGCLLLTYYLLCWDINTTFSVVANVITPFSEITAKLPVKMTDFEVNPTNGDLAAVSPITNMAYVFQHDDLLGDILDVTTALYETSVCKTPVSISYKEYENETYYAVACTEQADLVILNAHDLSSIATASIGGLGTSRVVSSQNPSDPFFYYFYGSGQDAAMAAFDVREMVDRGKAWSDRYNGVRDGEVSSDGNLAYVRQTWPTHRGRCLERENATTWMVQVPNFTTISQGHESYSPYVADTTGTMVAGALPRGTAVYSRELETQLAEVDLYDVVCWGNASNFLFGFISEGLYYYDMTATGIAVVSSEAFERISDTDVAFPQDFFEVDVPPIPRGIDSQGGMEEIDFRRRLLALDEFDDIILAYADRVSVIPYQCFLFGASTTVAPNATRVVLGDGPQVIRFVYSSSTTTAENLNLSISNLPDGAVFESSSAILVWTPNYNQIGTHELTSSLSLGDGRYCNFNITMNVTYPFMELPFEASNLQVEKSEERYAVAWIYERETDSSSRPKVSRVAIIPLQNEEAPVLTIQLNFEIDQILLTREHVLIAQKIEYPTNVQNVQVYNATNFVELNTFNVPSVSLDGFMVSEDLLIVRYHDDYLRTYNLKTFEMDGRQLYHTSQFESTRDLFREGTVQRGILYDDQQEPRPLMMLEGGPFQLASSSYTGLKTDWLFKIPAAVRFEPVYSFDGTNVYLQLEEKSDYDSGERTLKLYLWIISEHGDVLDRISVIGTTSGYRIDYDDRAVRSALAIGRDNAYVAFRDTLYRFDSRNLQTYEDSTSGPLQPRFVPEQTVFCIKDKQGETELTHTVLGGEEPWEFFDVDNLFDDDVARLDTSTGSVFINGTRFLREAQKSLINLEESERVRASRQTSEPTNQLRDCIVPGEEELPVSYEISIEAVDRQGQTASIGYYVVIGVPYESIPDKPDDPGDWPPPASSIAPTGNETDGPTPSPSFVSTTNETESSEGRDGDDPSSSPSEGPTKNETENGKERDDDPSSSSAASSFISFNVATLQAVAIVLVIGGINQI